MPEGYVEARNFQTKGYETLGREDYLVISPGECARNLSRCRGVRRGPQEARFWLAGVIVRAARRNPERSRRILKLETGFFNDSMTRWLNESISLGALPGPIRVLSMALMIRLLGGPTLLNKGGGVN